MASVSDVISQLSKESSEHREEVSSAIKTKLNQVLGELHEGSDDITASLVSSADGIAWAAKIPPGQDEHRFSAMGSTILAVGDTFAQEASKGQTQNVLIEGADGNIYVMHAGRNLLLMIITKKGSNLGMTLAHARKAADTIANLAI